MKNENQLAPIVLFVYNRLKHTKATIQALQNNSLAEESVLYIFSDGPKQPEEKESVEAVREYIKTVSGFKNIFINERDKNFGLAESIIDGTSTVLIQHGKIIVLEDDLITSKYFLKYMNDALKIFRDVENVFSVTGFSFTTKFMQFPKSYEEEIYLNIRPMSWSWATWIDRWEDVDWKVKDYDVFIKNSKQKKEFNRGGTDLTRMLKNQMNGKLNSWYIRWTFHAFKRNKLTVYPRIAYVNNIGHDASGVHCADDDNDIYAHIELNDREIKLWNKDIQLNNTIVKNFNKGFDTDYKKILRRKIKAIASKLKRKKK